MITQNYRALKQLKFPVNLNLKSFFFNQVIKLFQNLILVQREPTCFAV